MGESSDKYSTGRTMETVKRSVVLRVWGQKGRGEQEEHGIFRTVKLFCMM